MRSPFRGEVWLVDLGLAAKVRPALVLSVPAGESERALVTLVPHTTSLRNSCFEVLLPVQFLRSGAFDAQSLVTIPHAKACNVAPHDGATRAAYSYSTINSVDGSPTAMRGRLRLNVMLFVP